MREVDFTKQITVSKFSKGLNIGSAFNKVLSEIEGILELKKFSRLHRACMERIN